MIVVVTGGRGFDRPDWMTHALDDIHHLTPIRTLYHGGAKGADTLAGEWAKANAVPVAVCHANWRKHGKGAGPIRNIEMLMEALTDAFSVNQICLLVAFPGGKGTANCVQQAEGAGIPISYPHDPGIRYAP